MFFTSYKTKILNMFKKAYIFITDFFRGYHLFDRIICVPKH